LFGLGLGCLLFGCLRKQNPVAGYWVLALWAFEPTILAYASLAMADGSLAFFGLACVLAYRRSVASGSARFALAAGLFAAMAVTAKFSGLALVPILLILEVPQGGAFRVKRWAWGTAGFFFLIGLVYLPGWWGKPGGNWLDSYGFFRDGLLDMVKYGREAHHPTYFLGEATRRNHALYFPVAFVLKTTLPFLFLLLAALVRCVYRREKLETWVWVPASVFFLSVLGAQNLGVRYLLPAFPFLLIAAALSAATLSAATGNKAARWGILGLGIWHAATAWASFPAHLSYFNDLVPKEHKIRLLGDSNLDMGQDVRRLAERARLRGWPAVRLATSIGVDPGFYGMSWDWWTEKDLEGPQPGRVYAVNVSFLQLTPIFHPGTTPIARSWVTRLAPTEKVGETWWVWVIPGEAGSDFSRPLVSAPGLLRFGALRPKDWPGPVFPNGNPADHFVE
jgi:4-amino-4-deoxy-L-arabinose transferase-like glycosyltransferase